MLRTLATRVNGKRLVRHNWANLIVAIERVASVGSTPHRVGVDERRISAASASIDVSFRSIKIWPTTVSISLLVWTHRQHAIQPDEERQMERQ